MAARLKHPVWFRPATLGYLLGLVVLGVFVFKILYGPHGWFALRHLEQDLQRQQQRIQELEQENQELSRQIQQLKTDPAALERLARQRLGMVRPGELVFQLPSSASHANPAPPHTPPR